MLRLQKGLEVMTNFPLAKGKAIAVHGCPLAGATSDVCPGGSAHDVLGLLLELVGVSGDGGLDAVQQAGTVDLILVGTIFGWWRGSIQCLRSLSHRGAVIFQGGLCMWLIQSRRAKAG